MLSHQKPSIGLVELIFTQFLYKNQVPLINYDEIKFDKLKGDASSKQFYRVTIIQGKNQPKHFILMDIPTNKNRSDEFFVVDRLSEEVTQAHLWLEIATFLNEKLPRTPQVYGSKMLDKRGLVLVQDLGNQSLYDLIQESPNEQIKIGHCFEELIHWLARLQDCSSKLAYKHTLKKRKFENQAMMLEVEELLRFLKRMGYFQETLEDILLQFTTICEEIMRIQPLSIVHRDYQSKNVMYHNEQPYIIDIQDMSTGPILYDLASLLYDQNASLDRLERQRLAKIYWQSYGPQAKFNSYPEFLRALRLTGLIRVVHAIGRHATLFFHKGQKDRINSIRRGLKMLQSLEEDLKEENLIAFKLIDANRLLEKLS